MIKRKTRSVVRVSEGPTGVFTFWALSADAANLPTEGVGTGSICLIADSGKAYVYHEDDGWHELGGGEA